MKVLLRIIFSLLIAFAGLSIFVHKTQSEDIEVAAKFKPIHELSSIMFESEDEVEHKSIFDDNRLNVAIVANREVGVVGGSKYCSYYGFNNMAWCCVFISWCADQVGIINQGLMPRFYSVSSGYEQFRSLNQWISKYDKPDIGMVVFFDLAVGVSNEDGDLEFVDGHDYISDHVGLVVNVDEEYIYVVEGNYNNSVCKTKYPLYSSNIIGYGVPLYN